MGVVWWWVLCVCIYIIYLYMCVRLCVCFVGLLHSNPSIPHPVSPFLSGVLKFLWFFDLLIHSIQPPHKYLIDGLGVPCQPDLAGVDVDVAQEEAHLTKVVVGG